MKLKTICRSGLCVFCMMLLLCALAVNGSAAEKELTVEINGVEVDFTDAFPENHNNRNFLPFRAIFEALGAELYYDHKTYTGTAIRGDTIVEVLIGTNILTVSRDGGEKEIIEMDVASYSKNNRTYVPVGYMARALGFRAEWDQEHITIVLVDTETMLKEALDQYEYTLLEKSSAALERYNHGSWNVEGRIDYELTYGKTALVKAEAEYNGLVAENGKSQIFMSMDADYSVWHRARAAAQGMSLEAMGVDSDDLYPVMVSETRSDAVAGTNYLYVSKATGTLDNLPQKTWLTNVSTPAMSGMDLSTLLEEGSKLDAETIVRAAMAELDLTDCTTAVELAKTCAAEMAKALSDDAVVETEDGLMLSWRAVGVDNELLTLCDTNGNVTAVAWEQSTETNGVQTTTKTAVDKQGMVTYTALAENSGQTVYMAQSGIYTATKETPVTTLPKGVEAVSYSK